MLPTWLLGAACGAQALDSTQDCVIDGCLGLNVGLWTSAADTVRMARLMCLLAHSAGSSRPMAEEYVAGSPPARFTTLTAA